MPSYGIAEAKAQFSDLIERAARGEEVVVTRHGKPMVRFMPARPARRVAVEELRAALAKQPKQQGSVVDAIIAMRREARY